MSQYFLKSYEAFSGDIKVDFSNYATKADIKNVSHVDTSGFALKTNLANLKTEIDKLDIHKNDIIKKTGYNTKITELENKISDISNLATKSALNTDENKIADTSGLVEKTDYNAKITDLKNNIPDISNLATKTGLTAVENKMPNVGGLATKMALTAVENKIPDISNFATKTALTNLSNTVPDISTLIKKSDYDTKIAEIEIKCVSNTGFDSKLAQGNVITKKILM